jgi:hypothetical protein
MKGSIFGECGTSKGEALRCTKGNSVEFPGTQKDNKTGLGDKL